MSKANKLSKPILYIKEGCGWCHDALDFFKKHNVDIDVRSVSKNQSDMAHMVEISGQTLTPTLEFGDFIVSDFGVDELETALKNHPDIAQQLGILV